MTTQQNRSINSARTIDFGYVIGLAFLLFALFPYVSFGLNSMDSQPWALIAGIFFLIFNKSTEFPRFILIFFGFPIVVLFVVLVDNTIDFSSLRAIASYSTLTVTIIASYVFYKCYGVPVKALIISNLVYLFAGLIQFFYDPYIFSSFVNTRTSEERGVSSFSVEPTYFGMTLFFLNWFYFIIFNYKLTGKIRWLVIVNFLMIFFLAKSSGASLFVFLFLFFWIFKVSNGKIFATRILLLILFFGMFILFVDQFSEGTRIGWFYKELTDRGIVNLIMEDASINVRASDVIFPIHGLLINDFLPGGFHSYALVSERLRVFYDGFFWYGDSNNNIMSFWGGIVYELGFFGIFLIAFIFFIINYKKNRLFETALLFLLLFFAIPIGFTIVHLLFSLIFYKNIIDFYVEKGKRSSECS